MLINFGLIFNFTSDFSGIMRDDARDLLQKWLENYYWSAESHDRTIKIGHVSILQ